MRVQPIREILDNKYSTTIKSIEWGTSSVTADEELEMLKDTPQVLKYKDIDFTDTFVVNSGLPAIDSSNPAGVTVHLDVYNKEIELTENFEIKIEIDANKIRPEQIDSTVLTDKYLVAQAQVILFETKVIAKIKELLDGARSHVNGFEDTVDQTL